MPRWGDVKCVQGERERAGKREERETEGERKIGIALGAGVFGPSAALRGSKPFRDQEVAHVS